MEISLLGDIGKDSGLTYESALSSGDLRETSSRPRVCEKAGAGQEISGSWQVKIWHVFIAATLDISLSI